MFRGRRTTVCTGRRWSPSPMHFTRTSSMRHLRKDERERRVREAAAVAGADGAVGEAAAFLTEIKVAYDEPLTGDQHHGRPARWVPAPVLRALPRARTWQAGGGPRWPSTSSSCAVDPQNAAALIVRDGAADAAQCHGRRRARADIPTGHAGRTYDDDRAPTGVRRAAAYADDEETSPPMLLGAVVRDITDPFFAGAIDALSIEAHKCGYSVVCHAATCSMSQRSKPVSWSWTWPTSTCMR